MQTWPMSGCVAIINGRLVITFAPAFLKVNNSYK